LTSWWIPFVAVDVAKGGRSNFSHGQVAKVKKIIRKILLRPNQQEVDRLLLKTM